jgi:integrase
LRQPDIVISIRISLASGQVVVDTGVVSDSTPSVRVSRDAEFPEPVAGRIEPDRREAIGIEGAIAVWERELQRLGRRDNKALGRVRAVIDAINARAPDDLSKTAILSHLADRRAGADAIKAKTHDLILLDLRSFLGTCLVNGWISSNAAAAIPLLGRGVAEDPNDTGAFSFDEYQRIRLAAIADETGPRRFSYIRSPLYDVMFHAGLRVGEATSLHRNDLQLGRDPQVRCRKSTAKNAKMTWLPLHPDAAASLLAFVEASRPAPGDRLWSSKIHERVLLADMEAAGVPIVGADGLTRSFHAFRKGLATWLAERGVHPKLAQEILRHSDIRLTMALYTKLQSSLLRELVGAGAPTALTWLEGVRDEASQKSARNLVDRGGEGPDDAAAVWIPGSPMLNTLPSRDTASESSAAGGRHRGLHGTEQHRLAADSAAVSHPLSPHRNAEGGTRTPDLRVMNPAL